MGMCTIDKRIRITDEFIKIKKYIEKSIDTQIKESIVEQWSTLGYYTLWYDRVKYDKVIHNKNIYDKSTYDNVKYDKNIYDKNIYDKVKYDKNIYDKSIYDNVKYDKNIYDKVHYEILHFFFFLLILFHTCINPSFLINSISGNPPSPVAGIDLGTTNSAVAATINKVPNIIMNGANQRTTSSVIAYTRTQTTLIGDSAKRQAITNPKNTFFSLKRFIGCRYSESLEVFKNLPYDVEGKIDDVIKILCPNLDKKFYPEQLSALLIKELNKDATTFLNKEVPYCVITVPAYFTDSQRNATKDAGTIGGIKVKRIINEPTAASLAYGFDKIDYANLLVFDLGGGTFDVSLLEAGDGVFEVLSTTGNSNLGGDDIDTCIIDWLAKDFSDNNAIDLTKDVKACQRLKEAAEKAKIDLSSATSTTINIPFISNTNGEPKHIYKELSRAEFQTIIDDVLIKCLDPLKTVFSESKMKPSDINQTILVGGSTRIPAVQSLVKNEMDKEPNCSINPDEVVALGAAVQGGVLSGDVSQLILIDVNPLSLGIETLGGINSKLIPRNTSLPTSKNEIFTTAADNQTSVEINILQGERDIASSCKSLGNLKLDEIQAAPRGVPQIEVSFAIDVDGTLKVDATDKGTSKSKNIKIENTSKMSEEEKNKIIEDSNKFTEQDEEEKSNVILMNKADEIIYKATKIIKEQVDSFTSESLKTLYQAIDNLKLAMNSKNKENTVKYITEIEEILRASDKL